MTWIMWIVLAVVTVIMIFHAGHEGGRRQMDWEWRNRLDRLIWKVGELDYDALLVVSQAAQELERDQAEVMELEKLARARDTRVRSSK